MYRNADIANFFWNCEEYGSSVGGCTDNGITEEQEEFLEIYGGYITAHRGQEIPDKYQALSYNPNTGIVVLGGADSWSTHYRALVKVVQENGEWKIDGAGEINIPEEVIGNMYDNNR